jgi:hypothetical protein
MPALAVVLAAVALLLPADALASPHQTTLFSAPRELLSADAALRARTLDEIRDLGVRRLRLILYWHAVAPGADAARRPSFDERDPRAYNWGAYGRAIREARARGLSVLLTISGPVPRWATRSHTDLVTRPSPVRFRRFVTAVGRRFRTEVDHWSIWNEPNHPAFLAPQYSRHHRPLSGRLYRQLFLAGWRGLRDSGNGRDPVLMGETAPRGTGRVVAPLTFLRQALCLDAGGWHKWPSCSNLPADGYAHHAYTTRGGPWFRPPGRNDVTIGVLSRLNRALYRAGRAGAVRRGLGIHLTEFGIQSRPDPFLGVSFTAQAEYRAIAERIAYRNPRVRSFSQYLMRDSDPVPARGAGRWSGFESGLRSSRGTRKRAYEGFRLPLVALRRGRRVHLWGLVRPARAATVVRVEFRGRHGRRWHRLAAHRTGGRGYWSLTTAYRTGRRYRVRWQGHAGPPTRVYSARNDG